MGEDNLQSELSNLALNDSFDVLSADRLLQVEKAVDAAHATIAQQKLGYVNNRSQLPDNIRNDQENEIRLNDQILLHSENRTGYNGYVDTGPCLSDLVHQIDLMKRIENQEIRTPIENQFGNKANRSLNIIHGHQTAADKAGVSLVSSTLSISARYDEFSSDTEFRHRGIVSVATAEGNDRLIAKQEILQKNQEQEMEILQLKKYLTEYSLKETKLCIEKQALEKRISHMSLVFDQQQQDLSSSTSKANSYKQVIMEENVRLTYALQAAKEEESRFSDFLISFLANYGIESRGADAQTIVSNIKVLFRHLQERLLSTQENLKETEYELAPWQHEQKNELDLVPQPLYSGIKMLSSPHRMEIVEDASIFRQTGLNDLDRNSPIAGRNTASDNMFSPDAYHVPRDEGTGSRKVTFEENVSREMDETEGKRHQGGRDPNWNSSGTLDDPDSSPSLPTVLEEPSSSFSEAAEDDPLPAIEGLQISGKACLGEELQACGYSVNGTTSCNFEWVRHLEDGSVNYIDGAKQPTYLVTADDVDAYLAIEVQPLDDRKRKGDLVRVFANDHRKIACDALMVNCIEKTLYSGHASFTLLMLTGFLNIWEPATLSIKRSGYSIKRVGTNSSVVAKKFSSSMIVSISPESPTDFSIVDSMGTEQILRSENPDDISCWRDTIVLTLRRFILKAGEKKSRKISLFFNMQNKR